MTLNDVFTQIGEEPTSTAIYFVAIPVAAALFAWIGKGDAEKSPWKYIYSALIYLTSVPGIIALTLCAYTFLFDRKSFLDVEILAYFAPVISMLATLLIIQRVTDLDKIPGIGKLSGLLMTIMVLISIMYFLDRMNIHVIAWVRIPPLFLMLLFIGLLIAFRWGTKKLFA